MCKVKRVNTKILIIPVNAKKKRVGFDLFFFRKASGVERTLEKQVNLTEALLATAMTLDSVQSAQSKRLIQEYQTHTLLQ